jgi:hypothetical protein
MRPAAVSTVNGTERELQIEVENIPALAGKHVNVFVNGVRLASPVVGSLGVARVNRDTPRDSLSRASTPDRRCACERWPGH